MTELTFIGTGTSQGVPIIGCQCAVCRSVDPRDKRFRSAALVRHQGLQILVDAGPDFRSQMLAQGVPGAPEWHVHLIDERPFRVDPTDGAGSLEWVHDTGYFYRQPDGSLLPSDNAILEAPRERPNVIPIRGYHDQLPVLGFRFGNIAYITDMSSLPESEMGKLQGLEHLSLNTVSYHPHHSHFSLDQALELAGRIGARHTWLTHLSHTFPTHEAFCAQLRELCRERGIASDVQAAYDGLCIAD